jgi:hypothetical protein
MGVLAELGFAGADGSVLLIDPPAAVASEAGELKPRPGLASSIHVARPAAHIAWWPTSDHLSAATVSRLGWLGSAGGGDAWVVVDPADEDTPSLDQVREAASAAGLAAGEERMLGSGEVAIHLS